VKDSIRLAVVIAPRMAIRLRHGPRCHCPVQRVAKRRKPNYQNLSIAQRTRMLATMIANQRLEWCTRCGGSS
jgi:hypothetical protein